MYLTIMHFIFKHFSYSVQYSVKVDTSKEIHNNSSTTVVENQNNYTPRSTQV